jgi:DNA-binding transcriptional LysR family regulator
VRIAASVPPSMSIVPTALAEFRARHPEIRLRAHIGPIATLVQMLRDGDVSLALAMDDQLAPDIAVEVLGEVPMICLLPEGHDLCTKDRISFADLAAETLISYRALTRPAEEIARAARREGVDLAAGLEIDVSISAVGFVQAGLGVAVVDGLLPWHQFAGLVVRPLAVPIALPLALLTSQNRPLSQAETIMQAHLRSACAARLTAKP